MTDQDHARAAEGGNQQWLLTVLPAFPLLLLLLRLWYLSRQNLQTMLLLVQNVSPLGLVSTLLITLVWTLPLVVLVGRFLGALYAVSVPGPGARASGLVRAGLRIPSWVVGLVTMLGALTWQLRFLPLLAMMAVATLGLETRRRYPGRRRLTRTMCVWVPAAVAVVEYAWTGPAILTALGSGELGTAALLLVPPALAMLLTGPVPRRAAGQVTRWVAVVAVLAAPLVVGANFLKAPILPAVALETTNTAQPAAPRVTLGYVIAVNDRMTIVLDRQSRVHFFVNDDVVSETICPDDGQIPVVPVDVDGWQVEQPMLAWLAPARRDTSEDPRCQGRPLHHR